MMRFQVFLSLWSVTSCIDKIPEVAKTKVSKPEIFFIKLRPRPPKTAHSNTPPHVYVTVWEDLHNTAQMYTQDLHNTAQMYTQRKKAELLFSL